MSAVNHEAQLVRNISKLFRNESFNDVTINLSEGHGQVKANKAILCASSTYFANIFNNNVYDKGNQVIDVPTTKESMEFVLNYLYSGRMEFKDLSLKEILDLLQLFKFLKMDLFTKNLFPPKTGYFEPPFKLVQKHYLYIIELLLIFGVIMSLH